MNEHKNIITIEDEIKEFSDKPVKSSALFKALEEKGLPNASEASAGDVLSLDEDKKPTWAPSSGGGMPEDYPFERTSVFNDTIVITDDGVEIDLSAATSDPSTWAVKIDNVALQFEDGEFHAENDGISYTLYPEGEESFVEVWNIVADEPEPGTYSVKIDELAVDENFRDGVEACGTGSNVPNLPDPSETYEPQYIQQNRDGEWEWSGLRPAPIASMANPYAGVVEGAPAAFVTFPGHHDGGGVPSSMRTDSLYMLAYKNQPGIGMSKWGIREIMAPSLISGDPVGTTYTLKLKKTEANSYSLEWQRDT